MSLRVQQKALRMQGLGASEVAAVIGMSRWRRPIDVWREKTRFDGAPTPTEDEQLDADRARGVFLEDGMRRWYAHVQGRTVTPSDTLVHPEDKRILATPDGIAEPCAHDPVRLLLEIKCPRGARKGEWGDPGSDHVPDEYLVQVTWAMAVTGLARSHVAAMIRDELCVYEVPFAPELFAELRGRAMEFWERHVVSGVEPPIDASASYASYLRRKFGWVRDETQPIKAKRDEAAWVRRYQEARLRARQAEDEVGQAGNHVRAIMGEHGEMDCRYGRVTWRENRPTTVVDWRAVAEAAGATAEQVAAHTNERPGARVLRIPEAGEDVLAAMGRGFQKQRERSAG